MRGRAGSCASTSAGRPSTGRSTSATPGPSWSSPLSSATSSAAGLRVKLVSNLTDVNDKIYDAARAEGVPSDELARRYSAEYIADTDRLGLGRPDAEPTVTETVPQILELIGALVERASPTRPAATSTTGSRFPGYGRLSGRRLDEMEPQEPGPGKESPLDFALWKGRKPVRTPGGSPRGARAPGLAHRVLGDGRGDPRARFEVHGGGIDLVFPTTRTRSPSPRAPTAAGWRPSGCTTRCSSWATRR